MERWGDWEGVELTAFDKIQKKIAKGKYRYGETVQEKKRETIKKKLIRSQVESRNEWKKNEKGKSERHTFNPLIRALCYRLSYNEDLWINSSSHEEDFDSITLSLALSLDLKWKKYEAWTYQ